MRVRWETEGFVLKLCDSCHQHAWHQVDRYVWGRRNVTWTWSCDWRRLTRGFGLVNRVLYVVWRRCWFRWAVRAFWSGFSFFRLLFLRVDCECNRPSCLATVFYYASAFNGDLNQWDVAKVTSMFESKSLCIVENDWTWRELMLLCDWRRVPSGVWDCWWWCAVKMVERWCWKNAGDDWVYPHGAL